MIVIASDHAGYPLKEEIKAHLDEKKIEYIDAGCYSPERYDYALSAQKACDMVVAGEAEKAILVCGTGIGISMAANKVKGIRAVCCSDYFSAKYTRLHNDTCSVVTFGFPISTCCSKCNTIITALFSRNGCVLFP